MSTVMPEVRPIDRLSTPETRRFLNDFVKRRVPESHVEDVVQTVLVNALEAATIPASESDLRRWLTGIAKHKIADLHRKAGREQPTELLDIEAPAPPIEERQMAEWAEKQARLPSGRGSKDAERTLEWMAREGEGEKLEHIAADEKVEAATVRQRVSRMRRWMRERWIAELAAVAALGLIGFLVWSWLRAKPTEIVREAPSIGPIAPRDRAELLRKSAFEACAGRKYEACLWGLDQAKELDPAGDSAPEVQTARDDAKRAIEAPAPTSSSKSDAQPPVPTSPVAPTSSGTPQTPTAPPSWMSAPKAPTFTTTPGPSKEFANPKAPSTGEKKDGGGKPVGTGSTL